MNKTISVAEFSNAIVKYFNENNIYDTIIEYKFLDPQDVFNFIGVENTSENMSNILEAIELSINHRIRTDNDRIWWDIKHWDNYLPQHDKATGKKYHLDYFNDHNMHLENFPVGSKFIFGDGSYSLDLTLPAYGKNSKYWDRSVELDAEFEIIEEPYFTHYRYDFGDRQEIISIRVVITKSLKTGKIYRMLANKFDTSIVSSEFVTKKKYDNFLDYMDEIADDDIDYKF